MLWSCPHRGDIPGWTKAGRTVQKPFYPTIDNSVLYYLNGTFSIIHKGCGSDLMNLHKVTGIFHLKLPSLFTKMFGLIIGESDCCVKNFPAHNSDSENSLGQVTEQIDEWISHLQSNEFYSFYLFTIVLMLGLSSVYESKIHWLSSKNIHLIFQNLQTTVSCFKMLYRAVPHRCYETKYEVTTGWISELNKNNVWKCKVAVWLSAALEYGQVRCIFQNGTNPHSQVTECTRPYESHTQ